MRFLCGCYGTPGWLLRCCYAVARVPKLVAKMLLWAVAMVPGVVARVLLCGC